MVLLSLPCIILVERFGRRPLMLITLAIVAACSFGFFALSFPIQNHDDTGSKMAFLIIVAVFLVAYNAGPGPLGFFLSAELVRAEAREASVSLAVLVSFASLAVSMFAFFPAQTAAGGYALPHLCRPFHHLTSHLPSPPTRDAAEKTAE